MTILIIQRKVCSLKANIEERSTVFEIVIKLTIFKAKLRDHRRFHIRLFIRHIKVPLWSWCYSHHDDRDKRKHIGQLTSCKFIVGGKVERKINELKRKRSGVHKCGKEAKLYQRCQIGFKRFAFNLNDGGLLGIEVTWKTVNTFTFLLGEFLLCDAHAQTLTLIKRQKYYQFP